jgi:hypothetical protein
MQYEVRDHLSDQVGFLFSANAPIPTCQLYEPNVSSVAYLLSGLLWRIESGIVFVRISILLGVGVRVLFVRSAHC